MSFLPNLEGLNVLTFIFMLYIKLLLSEVTATFNIYMYIYSAWTCAINLILFPWFSIFSTYLVCFSDHVLYISLGGGIIRQSQTGTERVGILRLYH